MGVCVPRAAQVRCPMTTIKLQAMVGTEQMALQMLCILSSETGDPCSREVLDIQCLPFWLPFNITSFPSPDSRPVPQVALEKVSYVMSL